MKYLKLYENYNESELEEFCNDSLTLLLDENYSINIRNRPAGGRNIFISKSLSRTIIPFKWDDVKSEVITFIERLNESYEIGNCLKDYKIIISDNTNHIDYYKYDDIINDIMTETHNTSMRKSIKGKHKQDDYPKLDLDNITHIGIHIKK